MTGIIVIGAIAAGLLLYAATRNKSLDGMDDPQITLYNIRRGVAEGWYKAVLVRVNGKPGVYLYGKDTAGNSTGDTYPISENDWETLKNEGFSVVD